MRSSELAFNRGLQSYVSNSVNRAFLSGKYLRNSKIRTSDCFSQSIDVLPADHCETVSPKVAGFSLLGAKIRLPCVASCPDREAHDRDIPSQMPNVARYEYFRTTTQGNQESISCFAGSSSLVPLAIGAPQCELNANDFDGLQR
jgi:hypothetical protein